MVVSGRQVSLSISNYIPIFSFEFHTQFLEFTRNGEIKEKRFSEQKFCG